MCELSKSIRMNLIRIYMDVNAEHPLIGVKRQWFMRYKFLSLHLSRDSFCESLAQNSMSCSFFPPFRFYILYYSVVHQFKPTSWNLSIRCRFHGILSHLIIFSVQCASFFSSSPIRLFFLLFSFLVRSVPWIFRAEHHTIVYLMWLLKTFDEPNSTSDINVNEMRVRQKKTTTTISYTHTHTHVWKQIRWETIKKKRHTQTPMIHYSTSWKRGKKKKKMMMRKKKRS